VNLRVLLEEEGARVPGLGRERGLVARSHQGVISLGQSRATEEVSMPSKKDPTAKITDHEAEQVKRANAAGRVPVVFVHGL